MSLKYLLASICLVGVFLASCQKETNDENVSSDDDEVATGEINESSSDYIWEASTVAAITLNGSSITENTGGASASGSTLTITSSGNYSLSGTLSNGQIIVNTEDDEIVRLILNGVSVTCSNSSAIFVKKAKKVLIVLADNTMNTLTDGTSYSGVTDNEPNAAVFSKGDLLFYGNGSLTVTGNYADGIASKDGLIIKSGTISVTAKDDGVRGKDYLVVRDGNITVNAGGDGLKSDNGDSGSVGFILIDSGKFNITASGDGLSAQSKLVANGGTYVITTGGGSSKTILSTLSAKGIKGLTSVSLEGVSATISSADDGIHSNGKVIIGSGTYQISSADDGIHADSEVTITAGDILITKAVEGVEAHYITVNDGSLSVVASDDGLNATAGMATEQNDGSFIYIYGGTVVLSTTAGDALDSNGSIVMKAGTVIIHGPQSQPEVAMDYNGTFNISGGFLIAAGPNSGNMIQGVSSGSSQYSLKLTLGSSVSASTLFHIEDSSGNNLVTFKPARNYYYIVFSSPDLKSGSTYSVYTGGSSTGALSNGLYTGGTYSGGTLKTTFTVSASVTSISVR